MQKLKEVEPPSEPQSITIEMEEHLYTFHHPMDPSRHQQAGRFKFIPLNEVLPSRNFYTQIFHPPE